MGFRDGLSSSPLTLPGLLVGGLVPGPWLETMDRMGDGERFKAAGSDVRPAKCMPSRESEVMGWLVCSDWTTSAKEMKDSRRTSVESREP